MSTQADVATARSIAGEALARLRAIRAEHPDASVPQLRDLGDRGAEELIAARLAELAPGDAVLSEEAPDDRRRLGADRIWIVDPLDGTNGYGAGRDQWAVHIALVEGGRLAVGAVALGTTGEVLDSADPPRPPAHAGRPLRIAVSRSRPVPVARRAADALGAELVPMGSAGIKACAVATGEVDAYVHSGGQFEWDSAAPIAVARAAGLHTSRLDGSELVYNQPDVYLPDLVVCRADIRSDVMAALAGALGARR
ncbi:3'(2'),5'-bisphosphate nucleotidase CysQ [Microbacterium halophytorum]|uniref:3'(2'),5'-bisphosphate nucleotidase CysQ n=1 Tax=Microbacterium halophytorum TaxID=2067568 RepID=UPI000CFCD889|nr:3'(2'),5'-bisphosphate nucleotidase CysQ [Microbacterium halophytorum]